MRTSRMFLLALIPFAVFLSSCAHDLMVYRMASPFNVDITKKYVLVKENVQEKFSQAFVAYIFYGGDSYECSALIGECLRKHGGDVMTNVRVEYTWIYFVLGLYSRIEVTGDVWKRADDGLGYAPRDAYSLMNINGRICLVSVDGTDIREVRKGDLQ